MTCEQPLHLFSLKPLLPGGGLEAAPVFGVLVDDDELAAGLEYAGEFGYRSINVNSVFEAFGGVDEVEGIISKRVLGEGATDWRERRLRVGEHGQGEVEGDDFGVRVLVDQNAGKSQT